MDPKSFLILALIFSLLSNSPIVMSLAQINSRCTPTMLSSVTGCMSFLNGIATSPTWDCCDAIESLTGIGMDCLCLIVTAKLPLNLPSNRTLASALPRACGVPVQCKASSALLYAPGPESLDPTTSPPTETQYPEGPASFGPATSPTSSMDPDDMPDEMDMPRTSNGGDPREPPKTSASSPSSSHSLKLSLLLFALFEFISFF